MKNIKALYWKITFMFFAGISLFFTTYLASSHSLFPQEVVNLIEQNPNITDAELNKFFTDEYGYTLDEYFAQDSINNQLYADDFDAFSESDEYLSLQEKENLSKDAIDTLNEFTTKVTRNIFLENALELKYSTEGKSSWETFKTYISIGAVHILEGVDHILFVLSLLLLPFVFRKILILISIFTLSHSITIILAGLNIITLSSKIVEPIIAFSIIVTTVTALYLNYKKNTDKNMNIYPHCFIIFIFGLFHGLGFAGAFSALNIESSNYLLPLIFMNIGVEIGQLFILMLAFPIVWILRNQKYGYILLNMFSLIIIGFALLWFFERV